MYWKAILLHYVMLNISLEISQYINILYILLTDNFQLCKCDFSISAPPDRPPGDLWPSSSPLVFLRSWTIRTRWLRFWILLSLSTLTSREKKQIICLLTLSFYSSWPLPGTFECQAILAALFYCCSLFFFFLSVFFYLCALKSVTLHLFIQKWFTKIVCCLLKNIVTVFLISCNLFKLQTCPDQYRHTGK